MYKKILVSSTEEYLDQIMEHTIDLVHEREIEILGLYVIDNSFPIFTPVKVKEAMIKELEKRGKDILSSMESKLNKHEECRFKFKPLLLEGDPAEEIITTAKRADVDIIIMGTGKSKIDKHLLGSVSEKVIHSAPCTVLLVRIE